MVDDCFIHSGALVETGATIGPRTRVWPFVHILSGARIGSDCNICEQVFIENDVTVGDRVTIKAGVQLWDGIRLEDDVFIGPNVTFTNDIRPRSKQYQQAVIPTTVCRGASIGGNATILPGCTVGPWAMIGAGAVVTKSVPAHATVVGNPACFRGWLCKCARPLKISEGLTTSCACGLSFRLDSDKGLTELNQTSARKTQWNAAGVITNRVANGSTLKVLRYTPNRKQEWDLFIGQAKNATFLFQRDYMDYHADRFKDYSLMVYQEDELVAVYPASQSSETSITSHGGLTYGGFALRRDIKLQHALRCIHSVLQFLHQTGIHSVKHKKIPCFYNTLPCDEVEYALFMVNARLYRRDCAIAVSLSDRLPFQKGRKSEISKARRFGVVLQDGGDYSLFWKQVLEPRLAAKHQVAPVHSADEISRLATKFPKNIRLFTAHHHGEIVAGTVIYETPTVAHSQYLAVSEEGSHIGAIDYLFGWLINDVYKDKAYFDFGTCNEEQGRVLNTGLLNWKQGFGGRCFSHDFYEITTSEFSRLNQVMEEER